MISIFLLFRASSLPDFRPPPPAARPIAEQALALGARPEMQRGAGPRASRALPLKAILLLVSCAMRAESFCAPVLTETTPVPFAADPVRILVRGDHFVVVAKDSGCPCHRVERWNKAHGPPPKPMLQRVRDAVGERVNLVHRLDLGTSGALLLSLPDSIPGAADARRVARESPDAKVPTCPITGALAAAMASAASEKVYYAIVRGEGSKYREMGRFLVDKPIKTGPPLHRVKEARTHFTFLCGCEASRDATFTREDGEEALLHPRDFADTAGPGDYGRACLVRAELDTGRHHQIRRHLKSLSMPILGDTSHGSTHTNREWRNYGAPGRLALHCAKLRVPATEYTPEIDVTCPLPDDFVGILGITPLLGPAREQLPGLFPDGGAPDEADAVQNEKN